MVCVLLVDWMIGSPKAPRVALRGVGLLFSKSNQISERDPARCCACMHAQKHRERERCESLARSRCAAPMLAIFLSSAALSAAVKLEPCAADAAEHLQLSRLTLWPDFADASAAVGPNTSLEQDIYISILYNMRSDRWSGSIFLA